jgi:hypothetical protein
MENFIQGGSAAPAGIQLAMTAFSGSTVSTPMAN